MRFTSCFIGIPLPSQFQLEFEQLLDELIATNPYLKLVQKTTPHITLYYLDEQSQSNIREIANTIKNSVSKLQNCELTVSGLGVFDDQLPRVLYLSVTYPPVIQEVNSLFRQQLTQYHAADNDLPFHPHMTVARIPDEARAKYREYEDGIRELLSRKKWIFTIEELIIYGVDSRKEPEGQEKLLLLSV